jgi:hypothetical protein
MNTYVFSLDFRVTIDPDKLSTITKLVHGLNSDQENQEHAKQVALNIIDQYLTEMNQGWTWAKLEVLYPATTLNS